MAISIEEFTALVIGDGIQSAKEEFSDLSESESLEGALLGYARCRGKNPEELRLLLAEAQAASHRAESEKASDYWFIRSEELEIEWVCNCLSVLMGNRRMQPIMQPTMSAALKAREIILLNNSR